MKRKPQIPKMQNAISKHFLFSIRPSESADGENHFSWHGCDKVSKVKSMGGGGS